MKSSARRGRKSVYGYEAARAVTKARRREGHATPELPLLPCDRASDDGRCLACEGWGCHLCNSTGGY